MDAHATILYQSLSRTIYGGKVKRIEKDTLQCSARGAGTRIPGAGSYFDLFNYRAIFHMRCVWQKNWSSTFLSHTDLEN